MLLSKALTEMNRVIYLIGEVMGMKNWMGFLLGLILSGLTYVYLDWGILQIIGVIFVLTFVYEMDEKGPKWRQILWTIAAFGVMVVAHFFMADNVVYWIEIAGSVLLFLIAITLFFSISTAGSGAGSVVTFYFLGIVFCVPIAIYLMTLGLTGLAYM